MYNASLPKLSLKYQTINIFKSQIIQNTLDKFKCAGKAILILDSVASELISKYMTMTELISQGIFSVESLYVSRKPYRRCNAIYIIQCTEENFKLISKDFISEDKRLYENCHIFLLDGVGNYSNLVTQCMTQHLKSFSSFSIKYSILDKNLYYFGQKNNFNPLTNLYHFNENINNICIEQLFSICKITQTYPNIIYFIHDKNCKYIATQLNTLNEKYFTKQKKIVRNGKLLITSRLIDMVAPLQFDLNYGHLLFENFKSENSQQSDKNMITMNIDGKNTDIILDYNDNLYDKYKLYSLYEVLNILPDDFNAFMKSDISKVNRVSQMETLNEMGNAIRNFGKYQTTTKLFSQHLKMAENVKNSAKRRNVMSLLDLQSSIVSGANPKGTKLPAEELENFILENKDLYEKNDVLRILFLVNYYNNELDINSLINIFNNKNKFTDKEKQLINFFKTSTYSQIDKNDLKNLNKSIILHRSKYKYNTMEEKEHSGDRRFLCVKESKITTLCDMCCKNQLPENNFQYVVKPLLLNQSIPNNKVYKANILLANDEDIQCDSSKNENLILFNLGGLSNYEISSIEKAKFNRQFDMNIIYGSNRIYNQKEYIDFINSSGIMQQQGNIYGKNKGGNKIMFPDDSNEKINDIEETTDNLKENEVVNVYNQSETKNFKNFGFNKYQGNRK